MSDEWMEDAATPEGEEAAASLNAREHVDSPEGQMFIRANDLLANARTELSMARAALKGDEEPGWRGLRLRPSSAAQLRLMLNGLVEDVAEVAKVVDQIESRGG
jgi:hypothetical protein